MSPMFLILRFLQHLADDHLDVLVVDINSLRLVNALDFANEILLDAANALKFQNLLRIERPFGQPVARFDDLPRLDLQLATVRHQVSAAELDAAQTATRAVCARSSR